MENKKEGEGSWSWEDHLSTMEQWMKEQQEKHQQKIEAILTATVAFQQENETL